MSLFSASLMIEQADDFHLSRLLILINAFAGKAREDSIEGITKLAKLDFLLRYPTFLPRALLARHASPDAVHIRSFEKNSVESAMVRFKYGPWDFRYRKFINLMVARGLVHVSVKGRTVHIGITEGGRVIADKLASSDEFADIRARVAVLKRHFDLSATTLMDFIYKTFPEIIDLHYGQVID